MPYRCDATLIGLAPAAAIFGTDPDANYAPGSERVTVLDGTQPFLGYPIAVWKFGHLSVAEWANAKAVLAAGGYSGECYIETDDDDGNWNIYHAIARFPNPAKVEPWLDKYLYPEIEFVLLHVEPDGS